MEQVEVTVIRKGKIVGMSYSEYRELRIAETLAYWKQLRKTLSTK